MQPLLDRVLDSALSPALWLCILFGLVYGILFTIWRGGGFRQLGRDVLIGIVGFGAGQLVASGLSLPTVPVGEVHLLWGSLFAVVALLVARRYWRTRPGPKAAPRSPSP